MKYLIANLFILIFFIVSPAQPSGYLGKRFTLSYEQLTGPNYFNVLGMTNLHGDLIDNQVTESNAYWNYIGTISLDYVTGKTKSRGLSISSIDQTMYFEDYSVNMVNGYQEQSHFINNAKLTGFTIGAYVKYFKKRCIAPLGEYYKFEFLYSTLHIKSFYKQAQLYNLSNSRLEPFSTLGFAITFGKNRIFWDKIVVSAGITAGFRLGFLTQVFTPYESDESMAAFSELKKAAQYWHGQNLFYNLHLGVGWLLF